MSVNLPARNLLGALEKTLSNEAGAALDQAKRNAAAGDPVDDETAAGILLNRIATACREARLALIEQDKVDIERLRS